MAPPKSPPTTRRVAKTCASTSCAHPSPTTGWRSSTTEPCGWSSSSPDPTTTGAAKPRGAGVGRVGPGPEGTHRRSTLHHRPSSHDLRPSFQWIGKRSALFAFTKKCLITERRRLHANTPIPGIVDHQHARLAPTWGRGGGLGARIGHVGQRTQIEDELGLARARGGDAGIERDKSNQRTWWPDQDGLPTCAPELWPARPPPSESGGEGRDWLN